MGEKSSCVYRYTYTEYLTVYTKLYVNYVYANTDILYETRYTKYQAVYCSQPISQRSLHTDHKDLWASGFVISASFTYKWCHL